MLFHLCCGTATISTSTFHEYCRGVACRQPNQHCAECYGLSFQFYVDYSKPLAHFERVQQRQITMDGRQWLCSRTTLICIFRVIFRVDFMHFNNSIKFICCKLKNFQLSHLQLLDKAMTAHPVSAASSCAQTKTVEDDDGGHRSGKKVVPEQPNGKTINSKINCRCCTAH